MPAMAMKHDVDPRKVIIDAIGDISDVDVFNDMILIAIYERPSQTKSGLHLPDQIREEDQYQGKAGLIVKMGPVVNVDIKLARGGAFEEGDWVAFRPSEGWPITINKVRCRLVPERSIHLRIPAPDSVW